MGRKVCIFKNPTFFKQVILRYYYVYVVENGEKMCCDIMCCVYRLVYEPISGLHTKFVCFVMFLCFFI